jgi:hypothetical protein
VSESSGISSLLDEVKETVRVRGLEATVALLRNARQNTSADQNIQFVIVSVCNLLQVSIEHLLNQTSNDDPTKYAKGFIVYYLRNDFSISWTNIKVLLNHKNHVWLWQLQKLIRNLKPKVPADVQWLLIKEKLDDVMRDYKSKNI